MIDTVTTDIASMNHDTIAINKFNIDVKDLWNGIMFSTHDNNIATIHIASTSYETITVLVNITVEIDKYTAINYTIIIVVTSANTTIVARNDNMNNTAIITSTITNIIIGMCVVLILTIVLV